MTNQEFHMLLRVQPNEDLTDGEVFARPTIEWTDAQRHAWARFHDRARTGSNAEVLSALGDLLAVFPWMIPWFSAEGTRDESIDQLSGVLKNYMDASPCTDTVSSFVDDEAIDVEEYLDAEDARAALDAELDWLAEEDPQAAETIRLRLGRGGGEPRTLVEIGEEFGVTRECIRQREGRGVARMAIRSSRRALACEERDLAAELAERAVSLSRGSVQCEAERLLEVIDWGESAPRPRVVQSHPETTGQLALVLDTAC
jgi:hypothetical protein